MSKVSLTDIVAGAIAGEVVSFPTDTVPALAVRPELGQSLFALKQRPAHKPLILMAATTREFLPYLSGTSQELAIWQSTMTKYLPGALTLVLPASAKVPTVVNSGEPTTVGIRVPQNAIALSILQQTGVLATTSANISGRPPLMTMAAIAEAFPQILALDERTLTTEEFLTGSGQPSTVAKWTGNGWTILRQGSVSLAT